MWRGLLAAAMLYGYGHSAAYGYRPAALDRPLRDFHREVNHAAADGRRALIVLDDARAMRHLKVLLVAFD